MLSFCQNSGVIIFNYFHTVISGTMRRYGGSLPVSLSAQLPHCPRPALVGACIMVLVMMYGILSPPSLSFFASAQPVDFTLDFEDGNLRGWDPSGAAFYGQPNYGENKLAIALDQIPGHEGNYWVGTYSYAGPYLTYIPIENESGDSPQGVMYSRTFTIPEGRLSFLVSGGGSLDTRVELVADGGKRRLFHATGLNSETMRRVTWYLTQYAGQIGQIRVVDESSEEWGHINVDDFRFEGEPAAPLTADFSADITSGEEPLTVKFNDLSTGGPTGWRWDFGDGMTSGDENPSHTYSAGTYSVGLSVWNSGSDDETRKTNFIRVIEQVPIVEVPDVRGYDLYSEKSVVVRILGESGLNEGGFSEEDSNREQGIIVRQNPGPGSMVPRGSSVHLVVSTGRYALVTVPDLTGWNFYEEEDEILEILEESGLSEGNVYEESSSLDEGTILGQKPTAGSRLSRGSAVSLWVAEEEGWPWWPIIVIGGVVVGGGYGAYRILRPKITFKPHMKPGKPVIESSDSDPCQPEFTMRLAGGPGEQVIEGDASIIRDEEVKK